MGVIKGLLREELQRSLSMQKEYEKDLIRLPQGSLIKKKIKGHYYYYLVVREGKNVKFNYKGKCVSEKELIRYEKAKKKRAQLRNHISKLKKRIKYLRGTLRGKESI